MTGRRCLIEVGRAVLCTPVTTRNERRARSDAPYQIHLARTHSTSLPPSVNFGVASRAGCEARYPRRYRLGGAGSPLPPVTTRNERRARSDAPYQFIWRAPIRLRSRLRSTSAWRAGQAVRRATCSGLSADSRWRFGVRAPIHRNRFGFVSIELQNPAHLSTFLAVRTG
jgi:hypothetical protein